MKHARVLSLVLLTTELFGCVSALSGPRVAVKTEPGANPWTHLGFRNDPADFQFAIVSDRTGGMRPGVFKDAVGKLNHLQPEFVVCIGDLIEGGGEDAAVFKEQWDEFEAIIVGLEAPFFYVPGNHDLNQFEVSKDAWRHRFGRTYYHLRYHDVLFLCINCEDPPRRNISREQIEYFSNALAECQDVRWTLAFVHEPMWMYEDAVGWDEIEALLEGRPYTVFSGHTHEYMKYDRLGQRYLVLGTTGGGWAHEGVVAGEFDHVVWVTMSDEGPRVANLMLDGIADEDIRTEAAAQLIKPLLDGEAITSSPIVVDGPTFEKATAELHLTNGASIPMHVKALLHPNAQLCPSPTRVEITVPPNATERTSISLKADGPVPVHGLDPLLMEWCVTYEPAAQAPIRVERKQWIVVDTEFGCPWRNAAVVVDGRLDEWARLPLTCRQPAQILTDPQPWTGPGDCSFRFAVEHDDERLYVAVETVDDALVLKTKASPWKQDGVDILLDARPETERAQYTKEMDADGIIRVRLSPGPIPGETMVFQSENAPEGVQARCIATEAGLAAEIAVPTSHLTAMQGRTWTTVRVNVAVTDFDHAADRGVRIPWRPDWYTPASYPRSGTFRRLYP